MKQFRGKVAAITGAASGIGRALALELAARGCHLALSDVDEVGLRETGILASERQVTVTTQVVDVADRRAVFEWADEAASAHGAVHLVFNNAGVALASTVEKMSYEDFEWLMDINFWGVVHGTKAFLPHLKAAGEGHIVNISSVFGLAGMPSQSAYNAAKFAVRGFTESLRQELDMLGYGISATCVHPGGIKTAIARSARSDGSMSDLGLGTADPSAFEKNFITPASEAAQIILAGVTRNKRRVLVGPDARMFDWTVRLLPASYQRIAVRMSRRGRRR